MEERGVAWKHEEWEWTTEEFRRRGRPGRKPFCAFTSLRSSARNASAMRHAKHEHSRRLLAVSKSPLPKLCERNHSDPVRCKY